MLEDGASRAAQVRIGPQCRPEALFFSHLSTAGSSLSSRYGRSIIKSRTLKGSRGNDSFISRLPGVSLALVLVVRSYGNGSITIRPSYTVTNTSCPSSSPSSVLTLFGITMVKRFPIRRISDNSHQSSFPRMSDILVVVRREEAVLTRSKTS